MLGGIRLILLLSFCSGCATYTARAVPVPEFKAMPVRQIEQTMSVGVDPFIQADRLKDAFDEVLTDRGVLPLLVFVQNQGNKPIRIAGERAVLMLPDGTEIAQALPVLPPEEPPQRSQFCENAAMFGGAMPGPGLLVNLGCGIFGAARGANYQTQMTRWDDYNAKQLKSATLEKESWTHGFLFFEIPEEKRHLEEATLAFKFAEVFKPSEGKEVFGPEQTLRIALTRLSSK